MFILLHRAPGFPGTPLGPGLGPRARRPPPRAPAPPRPRGPGPPGPPPGRGSARTPRPARGSIRHALDDRPRRKRAGDGRLSTDQQLDLERRHVVGAGAGAGAGVRVVNGRRRRGRRGADGQPPPAVPPLLPAVPPAGTTNRPSRALEAPRT